MNSKQTREAVSANPNSILNTIKVMLGISPEDSSFDVDLIVHINAVLMTVKQLGCGPADGFVLTDAEQTWENYHSDFHDIDAVKQFIWLKVRLMFDPPSSGFVTNSFKELADEMAWRLASHGAGGSGDDNVDE